MCFEWQITRSNLRINGSIDEEWKKEEEENRSYVFSIEKKSSAVNQVP